MKVILVDGLGDLAGGISFRGLGSFRADAISKSRGIVKPAVLGALETDYRHSDTAWAYGDDQSGKEVGDAIRESILPRDKIYLVTTW